MSNGVLVDLTRCVGCRACVAACKQHNELPMNHSDYAAIQSDRHDDYHRYDHRAHRPPLSATDYTVVECHNPTDSQEDPVWVYVKRQCMHCEHPACMSACPVEAFYKTPEGPVIYKPERCMGCRYCLMACPFSIPTYQWDKPVPLVRKCTFCYDRISQDENVPRHERMPACVATCPVDTLQFGDREQLLEEARWRIEHNPGKYHPAIYGEKEAGGTSWLYLSPVPFTDLGFPGNIPETPYPEFTEQALGSVPPLIIAGGSILSFLYVMWKRKLEVAEEREQAGTREDD